MTARLRRALGDLLAGAFYGALGLVLLWIAIDRSRGLWDRAPAIPHGRSIWIAAAVGVALALAGTVAFALIRRRQCIDLRSRGFLGLGVLALLVLIGVAAILLIDPDEVPTFQRQQQRLIAAFPVDDGILFPGPDGTRNGPDLLTRNAIAATFALFCRRADARVKALNPQLYRDPFWPWLRRNWRVLVDWSLPPAPPPRSDQPLVAELWFYDASGCWRVNRDGEALEQAFMAALVNSTEWESRAPGMPGQLVDELSRHKPGAVVWLFATGDVNSAADAAEWSQLARKSNTKLSAFLLPSPARSGYPYRRAEQKALLVAAPGLQAMVTLSRQSPTVSEVKRLHHLLMLDDAEQKELGGKSDAADIFDRPRDLDELRRRLYGTEAARRASQEETTAGQALDRLFDELLQESHDANYTQPLPRWHARVMCLLVWAILGALAIPLLPHRTAARVLDSPRASWLARFGLLLCCAAGLASTVVGIWLLWPGGRWQIYGRPAMIVWAALASMGVLIAWPWLAKTWRVGERPIAGRCIRYAVLAGVLAIAPALGLTVWAGQVRCGLLLVPMLTMALMLLWGRGSGAAKAPADNRWARPWRWGPVGVGLSLWTAAFLAGIVEEPGGAVVYRRTLLALTTSAAVFCMVVFGVRRSTFVCAVLLSLALYSYGSM